VEHRESDLLVRFYCVLGGTLPFTARHGIKLCIFTYYSLKISFFANLHTYVFTSSPDLRRASAGGQTLPRRPDPVEPRLLLALDQMRCGPIEACRVILANAGRLELRTWRFLMKQLSVAGCDPLTPIFLKMRDRLLRQAGLLFARVLVRPSCQPFPPVLFKARDRWLRPSRLLFGAGNKLRFEIGGHVRAFRCEGRAHRRADPSTAEPRKRERCPR